MLKFSRPLFTPAFAGLAMLAFAWRFFSECLLRALRFSEAAGAPASNGQAAGPLLRGAERRRPLEAAGKKTGLGRLRSRKPENPSPVRSKPAKAVFFGLLLFGGGGGFAADSSPFAGAGKPAGHESASAGAPAKTGSPEGPAPSAPKQSFASAENRLGAGGAKSVMSPLYIGKQTGATEMNQALAKGDLKEFWQALGRGLFEKAATEFFKDWRTVNQEGDTVIHQLAALEASQDGSRPPAYYLLKLAAAVSFPKGKKVQTVKGVELGGFRFFKPLEKTGIGMGLITSDIQKIDQEIASLISGSAGDLLAVLHATTWSKKSIRGMTAQSQLSSEEAASFLKKIDFLEKLFAAPFHQRGGSWLLPADTARSRGLIENYYVLRSAFGSSQKEKGIDLYTLLGAAGVLAIWPYTIFSPDSMALENFSSEWGIGAAAAANMAFYGPPAIAAAGIACRRAFAGKMQKKIIRQVESL